MSKIIDISQGRLTRDVKKSLKVGPILIQSRRILSEDQLRYGNDFKEHTKRHMALKLGEYMLDNGFFKFYENKFSMSGMEGQEITAQCNMFYFGEEK